jgi:hypothetical protein
MGTEVQGQVLPHIPESKRVWCWFGTQMADILTLVLIGFPSYDVYSPLLQHSQFWCFVDPQHSSRIRSVVVLVIAHDDTQCSW